MTCATPDTLLSPAPPRTTFVWADVVTAIAGSVTVNAGTKRTCAFSTHGNVERRAGPIRRTITGLPRGDHLDTETYDAARCEKTAAHAAQDLIRDFFALLHADAIVEGAHRTGINQDQQRCRRHGCARVHLQNNSAWGSRIRAASQSDTECTSVCAIAHW
jgi:hypothetical protein